MDTSQTNPTMHSVPLGQLFVVNAAICCLTIMSCMLNIKWAILTERLSKHIVENSYQYPVSEHAKLYLHGSTGRSIKPELIQISFKQKQLTLTVDAPASNAKQSVLLLLTFDIANRKFSYYRKYYLPLFLKIKTEPRKLTFCLFR